VNILSCADSDIVDCSESCNYIRSENIREILKGASFLGSGGGGIYDEALELYQSNSPSEVEVRDLEDFSDDDFLVTIFSIGPVNHSTDDPLEAAKKSVEDYESEYSEIDGIILGELGPDLIIEAVYLADCLEIPIANADVAGMRAVPSVQYEIIEGTSISRTPLVASNGTKTINVSSGSGTHIDREIRDFTDGDNWYITGYGNTAKEYIESPAPQGWLEECLYLEEGDIEKLGEGRLESVTSEEVDGHNIGRIVIDGDQTMELLFQNENLLAYRDGEKISEPPHIISVINEEGIAVNNGDLPEEGELSVVRIKHDFWNDRNVFDLNALDINLGNNKVKFGERLEFEILGGQE
jgi:DUF917 family protein